MYYEPYYNTPMAAAMQASNGCQLLTYAADNKARQSSEWLRSHVGPTVKDIVDGVIYGLLTAGIFAWLWP